MRRREFIVAVGAGAAAHSLIGRANAAKVPTVGVMSLGRPDPEAFLRELLAGLERLGYVDGRNIRLDIRSAKGNVGALRRIADEFVRLEVDLIVAFHTLPSVAAKQATARIPIVMGAVGDPVGNGLVASFARPDANVTGSSSGAAETAIKIVELVRELIPKARRVAVLAPVTDPFAKPFLAQIELGGRTVGIATEPIMIGPDREVEAAFADIRGMPADAVVLQGSVLRKGIGELALRHRLPSFSPLKQLPEAGGLASYSAKVEPLYRETAGYVDRILKGAKPADLPVTFPTQFELIVNLKTAKALGLAIPETVLVRAEKLIE